MIPQPGPMGAVCRSMRTSSSRDVSCLALPASRCGRHIGVTARGTSRRDAAMRGLVRHYGRFTIKAAIQDQFVATAARGSGGLVNAAAQATIWCR